MQEDLSRCLLRLFPLITVAGMQLGFLIDAAFGLGTQPLSGRMQCAGR
jgi:hypothetical protein